MSEIVTCPNCSSPLDLKQDVPPGSRLRCPQCKSIFELNGTSPGFPSSTAPARGSGFSAGEELDAPIDWGDPPPVEKKQGKTSTALIVVLSVIGVVIVGLMVTLALVMNNSKLTEENVAKLKVGMSEADLVDLIGKPDSNSARSAKVFGFNPPANGTKVLMWLSGDDLIFVEVAQGKVAGWTGRIGKSTYSGGRLKDRRLNF